MHWRIASYQPVGLFSLKHGEATSTGGKSLLVPTPFAIRMALLDGAIRVYGKAYGEREAFPLVRRLRFALRPPERVVVSGLFTKVLKPERDKESDRAMQRTIAFREYVYLSGNLDLALGGEPEALNLLEELLPHITYFGKRGSFVQLLPPVQSLETQNDDPPPGFVPLTGPSAAGATVQGSFPATFPLGLLQRVDDWAEDITFGQANIYDRDAKLSVGRGRVRTDLVLPYRLSRAGRGFTVYERL